ncbi:MAG: integration host factor subunit alpha [Methylocystis sp.]
MSQGEILSPKSDDALDDNTENLRTTTRADLAEAVHRQTGFCRTDAAKYVEMVLDEIFNAIVAQEDVKLSSFGAFLVRAKKERQGRNPKTGESAKITARLVVAFKPSNVLRARVNNGFADIVEFGETGLERPEPNGESRPNGKAR